MLVDLKRMVSYVCPFCSNISSKYLSVFNFSGKDKLSLICPTYNCHETCASITAKNDKYKIEIECPLCGEHHSYSISRENFWHKPLVTYKCPAAGIDIFFLGNRAEVERTLDENSDLYSDIIDEYDIKEDNDSSFNMLYAIIEQLHKLLDKKKVRCVCGSHDIELNVVNGNTILSCKRCHRSKVIETNEENLTRLLNSSQIVLGS